MPIAAIAAIGLAGSIGGAAIASSGANRAANTQASAADYAAQLQKQAADESLAFQKQQWNTQQANAAPWLQMGESGLANLSYLLGLLPASSTAQAAPTAAADSFPGGLTVRPNPKLPSQDGDIASIGNFTPRQPAQAPASNVGVNPNLGSLVNPNLGAFGSLLQPFGEKFQAPTNLTEQNDPGFQARLKLGQDALERSAAAKGGVLTGGTAKDLNQFAQDYASNEYGNVYNRAWNEYANRYNQYQNNQSNLFNRLGALSGVGQTTANQLGMAGQNVANNVSSTLQNSASQIGQQANNAAAARASGYAAGANAWGGALQSGTNNISQLLLLKQMGMI